MSQLLFISYDNWVPSTFSLVPSCLVSEPNPNLGVSPVIVSSDPARDDLGSLFGTDPVVEMAKSRIRRRLMSEITSEYASLNRDLLRELAR